MQPYQLHLWMNHEEVNADLPKLYLSPNPDFALYCAPTQEPKSVSVPYTEQISAGKNSYVYDAHTYHTKVPPQGIERLINYYTRPGDVVLDPFCGSGMTGVAATLNGRCAMLSDLSPAAVFIAYNLNTPIDAGRYLDAVHKVLSLCKETETSLYSTHCRSCGRLTPVLYTVWSYGMLCDRCDHEFVLWDVARDEKPNVRESKIRTEFDCPHCGAHIKKRSLKRTRRYPVSIGYKCCEGGLKESTAPLDEFDLKTLARIERQGVPDGLWYPINPFPDGVNTRQPISAGITSVDKLLCKAFQEMRRVLKDQAWLTVVFHNSSDKVWAALQKAIVSAGFCIEGTQTFDKEHGTFKMFVSENAVGYDLVLHCRKSAAIPVLAVEDIEETRRQAKVFISDTLKQMQNQYIVRYLHVQRGDEFDYRRLYANWLADAIPRSLVSLSFEEFHTLVAEYLQNMKGQS